MRVAILGKFPPDPRTISGGVEAAFRYLVGGLARHHELEVHVISSAGGARSSARRERREGYDLELTPPFRRFEILRGFPSYSRFLASRLGEIQPEVLHVQDAGVDAYVGIRSGYPAVVTVHGIRRENRKYLASILKQARGWLQGVLIEGWVIRHARHVIAISRYVTDYFARILRPDVRVYRIPNAIDDEFFEAPDRHDGRAVLYAGRVIPRKNLHHLVEAMASVVRVVPDARLRVAGELTSCPEYSARVRDLVARLGLDRHVCFLGPLPEAQVLDEFSGAAVMALPAAQETAPMVIAQAMACRTPVVVTPVGGVPDMVRDGVCGSVVRVGDVEALAASLIRLLRDPSLRRAMGERGRRRAEAEYRAQAVADRTAEVYRAIAESSERGTAWSERPPAAVGTS